MESHDLCIIIIRLLSYIIIIIAIILPQISRVICTHIDRDHVSPICHVYSPISSLFRYFLIDARIYRLHLETKPPADPTASTSDKFILTSCLFPDKYRFPGAAVGPGLDIIALLRKPLRRVSAVLLICLVYPFPARERERFRFVAKGNLNIPH